MTEQNKLGEYGTGTEAESGMFECKICGRAFEKERGLFYHLQAKMEYNHPDWDELPVNKKVDEGGCFAWEIE